MRGHLREWLLRNRLRLLMVLVGVVVAAAVILPQLPRPIEGSGTLDECTIYRWPVVVLEGEDWRAAIPLPDDVRPYAQRQMPIVEWPSGLRFDSDAGALLDANGDVLFRKGDRVRIRGFVIRTDGDPAPCYYTIGVRVTEIAKP